MPAAEHGREHRVPTALGERRAPSGVEVLAADVEVHEVRGLGVVVSDERGLSLPLGSVRVCGDMRAGE